MRHHALGLLLFGISCVLLARWMRTRIPTPPMLDPCPICGAYADEPCDIGRHGRLP